MPDYNNLWDQYDLVVQALYNELGSAQVPGGATVHSAALLSRADLMLDTSRQLAAVAEQHLTAADAAEREQAMIELMAGAAADLAVIADLLETGPAPGVVTRTSTPSHFTELMADLGPIVRATKMPAAIVTRSLQLEAVPQTVEEALSRLTATTTQTFDAIAGDVIQVSQVTVNGLIALPISQIQKAAGVLAQEILNLVTEEMSPLMGRIARLLVEAYDKILKALGKEAADQARQRATEWIRMLQSGSTLYTLLENLYEKQRILEDIEAHVSNASPALLTEAFPKTIAEMQALVGRFDRQRQVLEWVLRGLNIVKATVLASEPWGPLGVTALYVGTLGYVVYAGGDYVDWFRTDQIQPLNRVPGLRDIPREYLQAAKETVQETE